MHCITVMMRSAADACSSLEVEAREFKPIIGGDYQLTMRFESNPNENWIIGSLQAIHRLKLRKLTQMQREKFP